jgi:hypothetical protein
MQRDTAGLHGLPGAKAAATMLILFEQASLHKTQRIGGVFE